MRLLPAFLALFGCLVMLSGVAAQDQVLLLALKAGLATAKNSCEDFKAQLQYEITSSDPTSPSKMVNRGETEIAFISRRHLMRRTLKSDAVEVRCINPDYAFHVTASSSESPFSLSWIQKCEGSVPPIAQRELVVAESIYLANYRAIGKFTWELLDCKDFRIKQIREMQNETKSVEVDFELDREGSLYKFRNESKGTLVFEPGKKWALSKYESYSSDSPPAKSTWKMASVIGSESLPLVVELEHLDYTSSQSLIFRYLGKLKRHSSNPPPEQFMISHFGLPEPYFGKSWNVRPFIAIGIGLFTFIAGRFFVLYRRNN